ncbi:MAG: thioredoxin family protein [Lutibacter sp.]|jgi:thioredoxin-like negative regulator of GroEL|uniref:thioredoxin family protein n=1 Tax=Lutibacter sp. TaxID=1925666 RepID=UPI00299F4F76|nr:thioredoxin family protein [Lutibacter sp.]MDX1829014.1 thioredoxin family protein [Lutibacter sp.]
MKDNQTINSLNRLEEILKSEIAVLLYFNTISCNVGESLEPKIKNLLNSNFPKLKFYTVDINFAPEVAAKCSAFVEPTIIVYFDGKETIRKSRNIGIYELEKLIARPYKLIFE